MDGYVNEEKIEADRKREKELIEQIGKMRDKLHEFRRELNDLEQKVRKV